MIKATLKNFARQPFKLFSSITVNGFSLPFCLHFFSSDTPKLLMASAQ